MATENPPPSECPKCGPDVKWQKKFNSGQAAWLCCSCRVLRAYVYQDGTP